MQGVSAGGLAPGRFERLSELMARMAAGERAALFDLYSEFDEAIAAALRKEFRRLGVYALDADDVRGLVLDVCTDLFERAGSWDAGHGVLPWTWARLRLRTLVVAFVGQFSEPLPAGGAFEPEAAAPVPAGAGAPAGDRAAQVDGLSVLERLASCRPEVRLLKEGLDRVSRREQQAILFEVKLQAALGDPSPALTVGREAGVRPDTVRQTVKRVLDRLRNLAATEPRFAPLAELHLLAA